MRLISLTLLTGLLVASACTNTDPHPVYIEMEYQVRCVRCEPLAPNDPPRRVRALPGDDGMDIRCSIEEISGDQRLTMSAVYLDPEDDSRNYAFQISQLNMEGGPGGSCQVKVIEGANTYEGGCTDDAPTASAPCRIEHTTEDNVIRGTLLCENISNANVNTARHLTQPGSDTEAFEWEVWNCGGAQSTGEDE